MGSPNPDHGPGPTLKKFKNPSWAPIERDILYQSLRELRRYEQINAVTSPRHDTKLWTSMSEILQSHGIIRTPNSCRTYWSRYGRAATGYDERIKPRPDMLATCVQRTKANSTQTNPKTSPIGATLPKFQASPGAMSSAVIVVSDESDTEDDNDNLAIYSLSKPPTMRKLKKSEPAKRDRASNALKIIEESNTSIMKNTRATDNVPTLQQPVAQVTNPSPILTSRLSTKALTIAELRARAGCVQWTPEQLTQLEAESIKAKGEIPVEEQYSWLCQRLGPCVNYQDIKDWFVVNAAVLAWKHRPVDTDDEDDVDVPSSISPPRSLLLSSEPYYPIDPSTVIPEMVVKHFQSLSPEEAKKKVADGMDARQSSGKLTYKRDFQSFSSGEGLEITFGNAGKRRLTQEESMRRFRERYPLSSKQAANSFTSSPEEGQEGNSIFSESSSRSSTLSLQSQNKSPMANSSEQPYTSRTPNVHDDEASLESDHEYRHEIEGSPTFKVALRLRRGRINSSTSAANQHSPSMPRRKHVDTLLLERRLQFEKAQLAAAERLLQNSGGFSGAYQHLTEKVAHSKEMIEKYQAEIDASAS